VRILVRDSARLADRSPGGAAARPIDVESPAVIELRAGSMGCPLCDGSVTVEEHVATVVDGEPLREAKVACRRCHTRRSVWFRLGSGAPN
jgi:hypothetical protein